MVNKKERRGIFRGVHTEYCIRSVYNIIFNPYGDHEITL